MNMLNRTILASLALCAVALTQSASAQDQVKSDSAIKSIPQSAVVKPVNTTVPPGYGDAKPSTKKPTISDAPTTNGKPAICIYPCK
jgi:hypothetical protein